MMPEGASLDYFSKWQNAPKMASGRSRRDAEDIFVQPSVIFPRVHVARNIRAFDGHPPHFVAMGVEKRAQASLRVERQQLASIDEVD